MLHQEDWAEGVYPQRFEEAGLGDLGDGFLGGGEEDAGEGKGQVEMVGFGREQLPGFFGGGLDG